MKNTHNTIRIVTLFLLGIVFTATVVNAQPGREDRPRELPDSARITEMVNHLDKELKLTAAQKAKINALFIAHFEKEKVQREKEKPQMEQLKANHENARNEFDASIKAELNNEQIDKFDAFNKSNKNKTRKGENDRPRR